ncbi:hypothetical protein [Jannaschia donghaensis]|nr:hypothetical protein [Jannaschia donghaensis]
MIHAPGSVDPVDAVDTIDLVDAVDLVDTVDGHFDISCRVAVM